MKYNLINAFLFLYIFFSYGILTAEWRNSWINALNDCNNKNYLSAEQGFNEAIAELEGSGDMHHPFVYVDRARLFLLCGRYKEALPDLDKAISSDKLANKDRVRAVVSRIAVYTHLEMNQSALDDLKYFREIYTDAPQAEYLNDKIIIRNIPSNDFFKNIMSILYVNSGICNSKSDINMLGSTWIINTSDKCRNKDPEAIK